MIVRPATTEDAPGIAGVHVRSWQVAYRGIVPSAYLDSLSIEQREAAWRANLGKTAAHTWVAEADASILGWISVGRSRDDDARASTGEVWAIYVDPRAWRRGTGRALWEAARTHLEAGGYDSVTLWVFKSNNRAIAFYASIGFSIESGVEKILERGGAQLVEVRLSRSLRRSEHD